MNLNVRNLIFSVVSLIPIAPFVLGFCCSNVFYFISEGWRGVLWFVNVLELIFSGFC